LNNEQGGFLRNIDNNIAQYQFLAKAGYQDIFTMPAGYLYTALKKLNELYIQELKAYASIFLAMRS
jgi:hypothetical protein